MYSVHLVNWSKGYCLRFLARGRCCVFLSFNEKTIRLTMAIALRDRTIEKIVDAEIEKDEAVRALEQLTGYSEK